MNNGSERELEVFIHEELRRLPPVQAQHYWPRVSTLVCGRTAGGRGGSVRGGHGR